MTTKEGPVEPAVTDRVMVLLHRAEYLIGQARYEGYHRQRQEPSPTHGTPWTTPDLPAGVRVRLEDAFDAIRETCRLANQHWATHGDEENQT